MPNSFKEIEKYKTCELVAELSKRQGVEKMTAAPYSKFDININENWDGKKYGAELTRSAVILIITD